jgi:serine protease Do
MLNNKEEQLRERELAYTAPIDSDIPSSFQLHSDLMPQPAVRRKSAERSRRRLAIALVCIILVLLCLALAISLFLLRYQIILGRDDGGFEVRIIKREDTIINPLEVLQPNDSTGDSNPDADSPNDYQCNGITLKTEDLRQDGIQSWSLIYQACSGCVANVSAIDTNGNVNKGSAVVMSSDGFLITSSHVVLYANDIQVNLQGSEYSAVLIGLDIASDLAVIRIQANSLTPAVFGQSELSAPGDDIAVLGTSYLGNAGISPGTMVSCAEQYAYRGFPMDLFELNIPVNAQYSGAPVVNQYGQVIGIINTDIDSQLSESANTSFAIPMHVAKGIVDQLLEYGYVPGRPSSGLTVAEIPTAYAMYYKYPSCVYVAAVNESSTAYEAGVRKGDLILSANGIKIQSVDQLYAVINGMEAGDEMTLELYRNGDLGSISFLLMEATRRVN